MPSGPPQSGDLSASLLGDVLPWLGILALLAIVGWLAIVFVRRRIRRSDEDEAPFTLDDLRRLHREGKLSDAEFARTRDAMIAATRRALARDGAIDAGVGRADATRRRPGTGGSTGPGSRR